MVKARAGGGLLLACGWVGLVLGGCDETAQDRDRRDAVVTDTGRVGDGSPDPLGDAAAPGRDAALPDGPAGRDVEAGTDGGELGVLAERYPGDDNIASDPAVVFAENFEGAAVSAIAARYEQVKNTAGMALVADVPARSSGQTSLQLTAGGGGPAATDLYKKLAPGYQALYLRYYVKYAGAPIWHHTGVWIGGYNPPLEWPNPAAGSRPTGSERFSIAVEPMGQGTSPGPQMDFYNYWMGMRSWMDQPSGDGAYWGNTLVHQQGFRVDNDSWMCLEIYVRLNPSPTSAAGAELALWKNDELVVHFTGDAPLGYWIKDKFCPSSADSPECTDYPPPEGTTLIPLDLQQRTTTDLELNYVWPQNYITEGDAGSVYYDDMVLATTRVGCLR